MCYRILCCRYGSPDDWKKLRWSLLDDGSGQGTYVNQVRLERGQSLVLNADDLIGFGSGESQRTRTDGLCVQTPGSSCLPDIRD